MMRPVRARDLKLFEYDADEKLLGEIPRSSIGLLFIFFNGLMLTGVLLTLLFLGVRYEADVREAISLDTAADLSGILSMAVMLLLILVFIGSSIAAYIYSNSYVVLTDQKLVLVNTKGLFARRISQLSIGDVQDVTIDQNSMLSRLFNYGHINIETAGEQANFTFSFADNPNENGKFIVDAHEQNLKLYGN